MRKTFLRSGHLAGAGRSCTILAVSLALVVLSTPQAMQAQTTKGAIVGTVKDPAGAVVPDVKVTATDPSTGLEREATTGPNGFFRIPELPAGIYHLRAESSGFAPIELRDVEVAIAQTRTVDMVLQVGARAETVTVEANVSLLDTESTKMGQVIDNTKVTSLPLNGRNFAQLARLNPGVAASGGGGGQQGGEGDVSGFSSNGQRSNSNNFLVDGIDNNNYISGAVASLPSIDSIQEFEVQTNTFAAEYGRNSGAVVNLVTRSGTNDLHGSVYEFFRNDSLDARNFFDNPLFTQPKLRLNQFGGTVGGPIVRNQTFFFFGYEGFRHRAGLTRITNVPTLDERQGMFTDSMGNPVLVGVHPASALLFDLFPEPNLSGAGGNFISSPTLSNETDQILIKIDHRFSSEDTLSGRYTYSSGDVFFPFVPGQGGTTIPGYGVINDNGSHLLSLSYTKLIGGNKLNEFRFGFNRTTGLNVNEAGPQAADFGFNTGHDSSSPRNLGNIPNITFSGGLVSGGAPISNLGGTINNPSGSWINTFQYLDNFSITKGRHSIKLGADIRRIQMNRIFDLSFSGQVIFDGNQNQEGIANPLIDFAEGLPSGSLQFVGDSARGFRTTSYHFFAQDSFKATPNLTVNFGLRYELNTVLTDATNRLSSFRADRFQTFLPPTVDQTDLDTLRLSGVVTEDDVDGIYNGDHNNFAPRVGLAYRLGRDGKTVVRAGYGLFYDTIIGNIPGNVMLNPPFLPDFFNAAPFISYPDSFGPTGFPILTITEVDYRTPYAQHFNLNVQRELPAEMLLEAAYVGSMGTKLPRFRQINQALTQQEDIDQLDPDVVTRMVILGIPLPVAQFLATNPALMPPIVRTPFYGYAALFQAENSVTSNYNSLQVKLNKRPTHGLSFLLAYTYSKSIDKGSAFFGTGANGTTIFPQNNFNTDAERGLSDFDLRHRLSFSYVYDVPAIAGIHRKLGEGWQIGGILTLQSGQPFSVLTGAGLSNTGPGASDRPNIVGDPNAGSSTVERFFNVDAFALNDPLSFGNAGRNILIGPNFKNFDLSIVKDTAITEAVKVQFRSEFFNLTNHPNFALPSNVLSAGNFGALFQTPDVAQNNVGLGSGGPRVIQFAVKLIF